MNKPLSNTRYPANPTDAHILVVEDNVSNFVLIARLLAFMGVQKCEWKTTGWGVVDFANTMPRVDLILMDLHLPHEDGYEALRQIRADSNLRDTLVVVVTAYGSSEEMKKAREAGIPVVNVSTRLDPKALAEIGCQNIPLVSVNNEQGAYLSAKALVADVKTPSKAMILEGIRQADSAEQRKQGARRAFAENPAVSLVASETANWKIDEAYDVTKKTLLAHPDISLIFAANDMMALGAIKYLRDTEKKNVKVAGFDALTEALQAIKAGEMAATLDQQGDEQGYQGVQYAVRLLKGETLPAETLLEVKLITADNVP